jgi:hypothetical protein
MKIANLVRLARMARRFNWHKTPVRFRASHVLLTSGVLKKRPASETRLVVERGGSNVQQGFAVVESASPERRSVFRNSGRPAGAIERAALLRGHSVAENLIRSSSDARLPESCDLFLVPPRASLAFG